MHIGYDILTISVTKSYIIGCRLYNVIRYLIMIYLLQIYHKGIYNAKFEVKCGKNETNLTESVVNLQQNGGRNCIILYGSLP